VEVVEAKVDVEGGGYHAATEHSNDLA
jgi:hypothetical protein